MIILFFVFLRGFVHFYMRLDTVSICGERRVKNILFNPLASLGLNYSNTAKYESSVIQIKLKVSCIVNFCLWYEVKKV